VLEDIKIFLSSVAGIITATILISGTIVAAARWLHGVASKIRAIHQQLTPNGGQSLADKIQKLTVQMDVETAARRFYWANTEAPMFECDEAGKCIWVNKPLMLLFGMDYNEMLGSGWLAGVAAEDRAGVWQNWSRAVEEEIPYEQTYRVRNVRTRNETTCIVTTHACYINGKPVRHFGVLKVVSGYAKDNP
jgi:PAS domain-containing protein